MSCFYGYLAKLNEFSINRISVRNIKGGFTLKPVTLPYLGPTTSL